MLVEVSDDLWINNNDHNVEAVFLDGPVFTDLGPRVMIRFRSGNQKLLPQGAKIKQVVAKLNHTDHAGGDLSIWDCEYPEDKPYGAWCIVHGNVTEISFEYGPHRPCEKVRVTKL